jgi:hypothetical protein
VVGSHIRCIDDPGTECQLSYLTSDHPTSATQIASEATGAGTHASLPGEGPGAGEADARPRQAGRRSRDGDQRRPGADYPRALSKAKDLCLDPRRSCLMFLVSEHVVVQCSPREWKPNHT